MRSLTARALVLVVGSLSLLGAGLAAAQPDPAPAPTAAAAAAAPGVPTPPAGFQADLLGDYGRVTKHLVELAEAMPADKFGWRPAEKVRTVGEVFTHVAGGNYMGAAALGLPAPAGVDPSKLEEITDKEKVLSTLRASIEHFKNAAAAVPAATLDEQIELFGMKMSKRRAMLIFQGHAHEHLGQAIAYARMNGVVPPWSQAAAGG